MSQRGQQASFNEARGTRDIEGKMTRVGASELGQRTSFNSLRRDNPALMPIYSRKVHVFRILFSSPLIEKR
jgi:hypothetical protein